MLGSPRRRAARSLLLQWRCRGRRPRGPAGSWPLRQWPSGGLATTATPGTIGGGSDDVRRARAALPRLLVLGRPGSGKGTHCRKLSARHGPPHLSTGDLLRSEVASRSRVGRLAADVMAAGGLVDDALVRQVIAGRIAAPDCWAAGWIGDGWVREAANAESVLGLEAPGLVVELDVPRDECLRRIGERVQRGERGSDGGAGGARADDAAALGRLDAYDAQRDAVLGAFRRAGVRTAVVDGSGSVAETAAQFEALWTQHFEPPSSPPPPLPTATPPPPARTVAGVGVLDAEAWWEGTAHEAAGSKLHALLVAAGASFWDPADLPGDFCGASDTGDTTAATNFVRAPAVALCAVGGIPLRLPAAGVTDDGTNVELGIGPRGEGPLVPVESLAAALRTQMGLASCVTYLNPRGAAPAALFDTVARLGHWSVGHTASLSFVVAGHSAGVENELNAQRDVVHLARLTVARTAAQAAPPLVVPHRDLLPLYAAVRAGTADALAVLKAGGRPGHVSADDWREGRFAAWPAAKAQVAVLTGSLRDLQKLVGGLDSPGGKESEYLALLWQLNAGLHALLPAMFQPNSAFAFEPPWLAAAEGVGDDRGGEGGGEGGGGRAAATA